MIFLLEILGRENRTEVEPEVFAKLGLVAFDDNDDLKKILFAKILEKRNKRRNFLPTNMFLYSFFMSSVNDENLKYISDDISKKEIDLLSEDYINFMAKTKKEDIMRSPEYLLVHLIYLMANNPMLLLNAKLIPHHAYKCLDLFVEKINRTKSPNRGEYFMNILYKLEESEPLVYEECGKTSMEFTDLKVKKTVRKPGREQTELQNMLFRDIIKNFIAYFKDTYGAKAVYTKRLPVTLPASLYIVNLNLAPLEVPRAVPLVLLSTKAKSGLFSPAHEQLPIKRLQFDDEPRLYFEQNEMRKVTFAQPEENKDKELSKSLAESIDYEHKVFIPSESLLQSGKKLGLNFSAKKEAPNVISAPIIILPNQPQKRKQESEKGNSTQPLPRDTRKVKKTS